MKYLSFKWLAKLSIYLALAGCTAQLLGCQRGNLDVVLVRDTSGSVKKYDRQMDQIVAQTLAKLRVGDSVVPMQYSSWASVLKDKEGQELILEIRGQNDKDRLLSAYRTLRSEGQWTYFRRAVQLAVERLVRYRKEHPSNAIPLILVVTDGVSDTPARERDLDPQTLAQLFRRPEAKEFKLHVVQVGELTQGKASTTRALSHLLNLQVVTVPNTPNLSKEAAAAIGDILHQARAGRSGSPSGPIAVVANWIKKVPASVPAKKIGLVALLALLVLGGVWVAYQFKKQEDPFAVPEQEEPNLQACILVRQEGKPASEHLFSLSDGGKEVLVGASPQVDVAIEDDEEILPKHLLLRLSVTGESQIKFLRKRGRSGSWQRLDEGIPLELSTQTSIMVTIQEEPVHALFLFEDEAL
jgi:hypothetical protein